MVDAKSRYRRVPTVTVLDARRGVVVATDIRPLPATTGVHRHTVAAGDRLDRLAWTFYGDPLQFWRICDANPDVLSPLALLGQEALETSRFPVGTTADRPPSWELLTTLRATVGVEEVTLVEQYTLEDQRRTVDGSVVTVTVERPARDVVVTYHPANVSSAELSAAIGEAGFTVGSPTDGGQVGRSIAVPVAESG